MGLGQVVQFADGFRQNTTHKLSSANEIAIVKALQVWFIQNLFYFNWVLTKL
jgi:hypothetical protein